MRKTMHKSVLWLYEQKTQSRDTWHHARLSASQMHTHTLTYTHAQADHMICSAAAERARWGCIRYFNMNLNLCHLDRAEVRTTEGSYPNHTALATLFLNTAYSLVCHKQTLLALFQRNSSTICWKNTSSLAGNHLSLEQTTLLPVKPGLVFTFLFLHK